MSKESDEKRIQELEDNRIKNLCHQVSEIHKIVVLGNGKESLIVSVTKNTTRIKGILWFIGIFVTGTIGMFIKSIF